MSREIRRVPPHWEHPRQECKHMPWAGGCDEAKAHHGRCYRPLLNNDYQSAAREWLDAAIAWDNGTDPSAAEYKATHPFYWQWNGNPPEPEDYRPFWTPEEATHYQVYETVSEGTPVTPHFATLGEIANYLVEYGEFNDQHRGDGGWSRDAAEQFVKRGWAPSGMSCQGKWYSPRDGMPI